MTTTQATYRLVFVIGRAATFVGASFLLLGATSGFTFDGRMFRSWVLVSALTIVLEVLTLVLWPVRWLADDRSGKARSGVAAIPMVCVALFGLGWALGGSSASSTRPLAQIMAYR